MTQKRTFAGKPSICPLYFIALFFAGFFLFTGFPLSCKCEESDESSEEDTFLALPFFMYTSDTGFGGGGGCIKSYHSSEEHASTIQALALYTVKKQFSSTIKWEHFFSSGNRLLLHLSYAKFPMYFYGIGNTTENDDPEKFTPEYVEMKLSYERRLISRLKFKTLFLFRNQSLLKTEPDKMLETSPVPWKSGRLDAGPGIGLVWDSRDNTYSTLHGTFIQVEYEGILYQNKGHSYNSVSLDIRHFYNPFSDVVLGSMVRFKDLRGDVPFYLFHALGGADRLRGYEENRFVGKSGILFQHDIRFHIWWNIAGAVFIATGRVADNEDSPLKGQFHTSYGFGPRYIVNKKDRLVMRCDYAVGSDSKGVYFTFSEAF